MRPGDTGHPLQLIAPRDLLQIGLAQRRMAPHLHPLLVVERALSNPQILHLQGRQKGPPLSIAAHIKPLPQGFDARNILIFQIPLGPNGLQKPVHLVELSTHLLVGLLHATEAAFRLALFFQPMDVVPKRAPIGQLLDRFKSLTDELHALTRQARALLNDVLTDSNLAKIVEQRRVF